MFGLVLGSGSARGLAHIGVIKVLEDMGIKPDIVVGSSMGAIVGGSYASGVEIDEINEIATSLDYKKFIKLVDFAGMKYGIKGKKIENFFRGIVKTRKIEKFPIKFAAVATDLISGKEIILSRGDAPIAMRASGSIPGIFKPVKYKNMILVDGGVVDPVPVKAARLMGAYNMLSVDVNHKIGKMKTKDIGIVPSLMRSIDIMQKSLSKNYDDNVLRLNPDVSEISPFSFMKAKKIIKIGYNVAKKNKKKIKDFLGV